MCISAAGSKRSVKQHYLSQMYADGPFPQLPPDKAEQITALGNAHHAKRFIHYAALVQPGPVGTPPGRHAEVKLVLVWSTKWPRAVLGRLGRRIAAGSLSATGTQWVGSSSFSICNIASRACSSWEINPR